MKLCCNFFLIELMFSIQLLKSPDIVYKELGIPSVILGQVLL